MNTSKQNGHQSQTAVFAYGTFDAGQQSLFPSAHPASAHEI
jgi:hypothetical protein